MDEDKDLETALNSTYGPLRKFAGEETRTPLQTVIDYQNMPYVSSRLMLPRYNLQQELKMVSDVLQDNMESQT